MTHLTERDYQGDLLAWAALLGMTEEVRWLLAEGADPTHDYSLALRWAADKEHEDIVIMLNRHINGGA